ncbi:MAG TPA: hypothetical protein VFU31_06200 [Candidatus Binatia bacterium]|nr:hypothetical protein [Candidatus Binatia bacterium]
MNAVDTNVLLYIHDPRDLTKQVTASNLLQSLTDGVLLWQVACEYLAASRKLVPFGYNLTQAYQDVRDLQRVWFTLLPSWSTLDRAETWRVFAADAVQGSLKQAFIGDEDFVEQGESEGSEAVELRPNHPDLSASLKRCVR